MKLIVGLGNPGPKYTGTRHNIGFAVIDALAAAYSVALTTEKFHAWFGKATIADEPVVLLKPTTYMNRSGQAVAEAGRFYKLELSDLLVISDDLALPVARLRMRASGSAGGHNGLQNICDRIGSDQWCRLRIGIGQPLGDPAAYVLGRFYDSEMPLIGTATSRAVGAVESWIRRGVEATMNEFNGDPPDVERTTDDE
ncbi:MAG: aminoacyl-tRNA hydrolase [Phycisphaerae bacterium]